MLVLANGVFAGAELGLLSVRKTRLKELLEQGSKSAKAVAALRDDPERLLATVQIGITVIGSTAAAFGGASIAHRLAGVLAGLGVPEATASQAAFALVVALVSYLSLVLGELVPKSLALRYSEQYALTLGRPLKSLAWVMRPLVWFLTASSNVVLKLFGDKTNFSESRLSPDELLQLVEEASKQGTLDPRAGEIASRAFALGDLTLGEVMVTREHIVALRRHASNEEIRQVLLEHGHSRMPVYESTLDNVVGYIVAKDLLGVAWEGHLIVLEDVLRPPLFLVESMRAIAAMKELQRRRMQLAVVVDEHGGVVGLVTVEDLVEELVGDILSESETPEVLVRREGPSIAVVQGEASLREVNRALELELEESEDYSTVAGLCIALAGGAIPEQGTKLPMPDGTVLEVLEASPRRVRQVRFHLPEQPAQPEA
ncbi:HlyC/CorC family transporter [Corallococcus exiguus]|uniref:hemolysin family protein n=1 Tax=Corallococcus TaxID=83461 RepID=UPI000EE97546|nr:MULTISPECIES: hemolysin family protein [Corallococcus]NNB85757.1 HlyC/CorC family transporter [Corallococcus exiguus]NNB95763.1 HlyC/CorC family transporter [Corallococcus exiguus]NNC06132.1 HlyC/CorC family transporter [Corallococcus exiguus]NPC46486.1 HlyC/CorC family transporter [Corallococcus exiguus]RKH79452.1 HlyC/CorC family transporter [Corallococcus sp. AB032C]